MAFPEDHKEFFRGIVEKHIEGYREQLVEHRKSLRLLDKEKTQPLYVVVIVSAWKNVTHYLDEKDVTLRYAGSVRDAIKAAEKQFMEINNRSDVQGHYQVGLKVGDVVESLPTHLWWKFKKRK